MPVYFIWLKYLSFCYYVNEITMINQWRNVDYIPCEHSLVTNMTETNCYANGQQVISSLSLNEVNV